MILEGNTSLFLRWTLADHSRNLLKHFLHFPITYSVEVSVDNGKHWKEHLSNLLDPSCTLDNLDLNTNYKFRVRAHNEFGHSDPTLPLDLQAEKGNTVIYIYFLLLIFRGIVYICLSHMHVKLVYWYLHVHGYM